MQFVELNGVKRRSSSWIRYRTDLQICAFLRREGLDTFRILFIRIGIVPKISM